MFDEMNVVFYDMDFVNPVRMMVPGQHLVQLQHQSAYCVSVEM